MAHKQFRRIRDTHTKMVSVWVRISWEIEKLGKLHKIQKEKKKNTPPHVAKR